MNLFTIFFIATNSLTKDKISQLVSFLYRQYTIILLTYIINPVLECRMTVYSAWYVSTLDMTTKPNPRGAGMFSGRTYLLET